MAGGRRASKSSSNGTGISSLNEAFSPKAFTLGSLKVFPLAFDSLGVRSMATFVETPDVRIFIDPSAALGPKRYQLPPHPLEEEALRKALEVIRKFLKETDVIVITHYHFDHYSPELRDLYMGKKLIIKHPTGYINKSQRSRAQQFLSQATYDYTYGDENSFQFGKTQLILSTPIPHGPNDKLGYVLQVLIKRGEDKFLFTSDLQGFIHDSSLSFPLEHRPQLIIADGPPTYMLGTKLSPASYNRFKENTKRLIQELSGDLQHLVLDHHLTRDKRWRRRIEDLIKLGEERGVKVLSVAELLGKKFNTLEALRKELHSGEFEEREKGK